MISLGYKNYKPILFIIFLYNSFVNLSYSQEQDYLNAVIERITDLEKDLKNIQDKKINDFNNPSNGNYTNAIAKHEQKIIELEEEFRILRGTLEELNFKINNMNEILKSINTYQKQENHIEENNLTNNEQMETLPGTNENSSIIEDPNVKKNPSMKVLGTITESSNENSKDILPEKKADPESLPKEAMKQEIIPEENLSLLSKNPSEIYSYAYDMLVRENFIEAEKSFKAFIGEHPNDPLASNAYYWLGETYYVQKKFQLAAISFARGFQNFPKGNKAIDQLFKLALTFMNLGKNEDACAAFSKLESEFPDIPKRISNRAEEYIKRAKC